MVSSFSNLVYNRSKGVHRKFRHGNKKCETCRIECKYCDCFLKYINFKDNLIEYKCLYCNKNYECKFEKKLREGFLTHTDFLTMIKTSLFYCQEKVFILRKIWTIGKNSMNFHYLQKKIFTVT